jgi:hypothetical protein
MKRMSPRVYVDNLTLISLIYWFLISRPKIGGGAEIWYFNRISSTAKWILKCLAISGYVVDIRQVDYCWGKLRSDDGNAVWNKVAATDLKLICDKVRKGELERSQFLLKLGAHYFERKRLLLYMEKRVYAEIEEFAIYINVVERQVKDRLIESQQVYLLLRSNKWASYLFEYGLEKKVNLVSYPCLPSGLKHDVFRFVYFALSGLPKIFFGAIGTAYKRLSGRSRKEDAKRPIISISHSGFEANGDRGRRHDLFWWLETKIDPACVLLYCSRTDRPMKKDEKAYLEELGLSFIAITPGAIEGSGAPLWKPTWVFYQIGFRLWASVLWAFVGSLLIEKGKIVAYLQYISALVFDFSFWFDFFKTQGIRVNVNYSEFASYNGMACTMALRQLNGISISYQGSNLYDVTTEITPSSDILFSYSSLFVDLWERSKLPTENFVYTGYVFDGVFKEVETRSILERKKLYDRGARFIIAYFDENSSSSRNAIIPNEDARSIYTLLLQKLLTDDTLGLVCKPKKAKNLFERIAGIGSLLDEAMATGRLLFMDNPQTYPSEAGMIADIAIGDLVGTTAALESYLSGAPSILVDAMGMKMHPYYEWGRDSVVFETWADAFKSIAEYRVDPSAMPDFGNWGPIADKFDPFRDGRAGYRMGTYIESLLQNLREGEEATRVIEYANKRYMEIWGPNTIGSDMDEIEILHKTSNDKIGN